MINDLMKKIQVLQYSKFLIVILYISWHSSVNHEILCARGCSALTQAELEMRRPLSSY